MQGFNPWFFLAPMLLFVFVSIVMCIAFRKRTSSMMAYSRCLNIAVTHERISIHELADKCEMTEEEVVKSIEWGKRYSMPITIEDGYFVRLADLSAFQKGTQAVMYLVICPHCGHKNQQGVAECENCGASL